jgi:hypothetical protein
VRRDELDELHYIAPLSNVSSICRLGILSHRRAEKVAHESVAMQEIQDRRVRVMIPGGRRLHDYVNLYICARNPMLSKKRAQHNALCVLRISPSVLDLPGVVVTDGNASSDYVRFAAAPDGLRIVDRELTFAEYWTDSDRIQYYRKKSAKCAEVLVPDRVDPQFLIGAYVSCDESLIQLNSMGVSIVTTIDRYLFFR